MGFGPKDYAWWHVMEGGGYPTIIDDGNTVAWFDFNSSYITKDGSDFVSQWSDRSGNNNHLLQATGTNQPLWQVLGVLFDGVDNFMKCVAFTLIQPEMIYVVMKQATWSLNDVFFDGNTDAKGIIYQSTPPNQLIAYGGSVSSENSNLALNTFSVIRLLFNGASSKFIINETTPVTGNFGALDMGGFMIGNRATGAAYANIEVKEIILRNIADTAPNEAIIYNYLAAKYSI